MTPGYEIAEETEKKKRNKKKKRLEKYLDSHASPRV